VPAQQQVLLRATIEILVDVAWTLDAFLLDIYFCRALAMVKESGTYLSAYRWNIFSFSRGKALALALKS
jgi:hypothetical protein